MEALIWSGAITVAENDGSGWTMPLRASQDIQNTQDATA